MTEKLIVLIEGMLLSSELNGCPRTRRALEETYFTALRETRPADIQAEQKTT